MNQLVNYPPQNLLKIVYKNKETEIFMPVVYNLIHIKKYKGLTSKVYKIPNSELACYFRQANYNSIAVTVRNPNITDNKINRLKIFFAKILSVITPKKDIILLYEKENPLII